MPESTRLLEGSPLTEEEWAAAEKRFPREDWKFEVGNDDTVLGYADWVEHRILGSSDGGERYFCIDSRGEAVFPGDQVTVLLNKDGSPPSFSGTVLRFNTHDAGAVFLEDLDQYRDLFECLPSQIVLTETR
jgi:hypothetical protein